MNLEEIRQTPNVLAEYYSRFRVDERWLLTGHSHQAWPDCGFTGQQQAWLDAAEYVDDKWGNAFAMARRVRQGYAKLLGEDHAAADSRLVLGPSTHDLLVRLLSALPLRERPRLVTTAGEFHTIRRQLDRLAEEGVEVVRVPVNDHQDIAARLCAEVDERTSLVLVSSVLFTTGRRVDGLDQVASACARCGADMLVDAYHHVNAVPFSLTELGLTDAFVVGGGYKYCQLGEGNAFLRIPDNRHLRPVITGWFAEFELLDQGERAEGVAYGPGATSLAGSTYDPTSHYRAAAVLDFFAEKDLTPQFLRQVSRHQVGLLAASFDDLDLNPKLIFRPDVPLEEIAGFLVLESPHANRLCALLHERGVMTDSRGDRLRLGPAPYLNDNQLGQAIALLGEVVAEVRDGP